MKKSILFIWILLAVAFFSSSAPASTVFPSNSVWKYFKGTTEASTPDATAWRNLGFDDSTWLTGAAPFFYDSDTSATGYTGNTKLADMQGGYTCIFMRKTVVITNIAQISQIAFGAVSDDGFILWLNGNEVYRFNMPAGPIAFNGTANPALAEPVPYQNFTVTNLSWLLEGTNMIAVQAFNASLAGSSDFTIDLLMTSSAPDTNPPVVISKTPPPGTVGSMGQVTVTFSESVQGIDAADFLVNGVAATNVVVSGNLDNYTFSFTPPPYGNVQITWAANHGITDYGTPAVNPFDANGAGATWSYTYRDITAPTVVSANPPKFVTVHNLNQITITFSEPVSGVDASDLLISGTPATGLVVNSSSTYTFQFPAVAPGTVNIAFAGNAGIQDLAAPPNNFAGDNWNYIVDPNASSTGVRINEFVSANANGIKDDFGNNEDWIELFNSSSNAVNLAGFSLTDDPAVTNKWVFPQYVLPANGFLVVFASGKNLYLTNAPHTNFHTNFKLSNTGEYLALYNSDVPQHLLTEFNPFPLQRTDVSYGYATNGSLVYFQTPTPRTANGFSTVTNIVGDVHFTPNRGFYNTPFNLTIFSETTNATIKYTVNGSAPSASNGFLYTNTLFISSSTNIRAIALMPGALSSDIHTHSYLFVNDISHQSNNLAPGPGWPAENKAGSPDYDYGMDPTVLALPYVTNEIASDMLALPSYCIVMDLNDLFNPSTTPSIGGIYANPRGDTIAWEKPGSLELIYPDNGGGFQANCGIRVRGGYSRDPSNPKHGFRIFFRSDYGLSSLNYPVAGPNATDTFQKFDLRTFENYSWSFGGDKANFIAMRDVWNRDTQAAMGSPTSHGDYFHLYLNGEYWGIYNIDERPEANFGASYFGGDAADYDTIKVAPEDGYVIGPTDGDFGAWTRLWMIATNGTVSANPYPGFSGNGVTNGLASDAAYEKIQGHNPDGTPNPLYENLLDVDNLIDYMLVIYYGGNADAPISNFIGNTSPNNFFAMRNRDGQHGGFRFVAHDSEHTLGQPLGPNVDRTGPFPAGDPYSGGGLTKSNPQWLFQCMWGNQELRMRAADHIQKHFFNGGVLTPQSALARFLVRSNQLFMAINAESARWGDAKTSPAATRQDWMNACSTVINTFFPGRTATVLTQFRNHGLYPTLNAPILSQFGGIVPGGYSLSMTNPNATGTIYYTLDGTDPRLRGGAIAPTARNYTTTGPITINSQTIVRTRVKDGNNWSALIDTTFYVLQDYTKLLVSELMYNPPLFGTNDGDNYEFLELKNTGTNSMDLSGLTFTSG
ncbi:MAG TPA: lamin tail domain-containing protein, partial [Verrucomicrobiae bacterium]